jgi:D-beta-D-heptose 7-phosphate kinase/D-beta-D-heptose 1-phosphate adenosyltransferase
MGQVVTLEELVSAVVRHRRVADSLNQQSTIVFTNGCFDLLHVGHVRLLQHARTLGNFIIVGVNSDESVRYAKGPLRPLVPEEERAEIVASILGVTYAFIFREPTPLSIIKLLVPDVLIKGADWGEAIVGSEEIRKSGGMVVSFPLVGTRSSSQLIRSIQQRYYHEGG